MTTEPWVTALDVAKHLGIAKDTVYRWRERKGLPHMLRFAEVFPDFEIVSAVQRQA